MERLAALRYSKALFDIALENNDIDNFNNAAMVLSEVLAGDELFFADPAKSLYTKGAKIRYCAWRA
jgi:F0F1-type ATP synthase delta subunit